MRRDLESLVRKIREELRAEGPDGAGFSDFFIGEQINSAIGDLAEFFHLRDTVEISTEEGQNQYRLDDFVSQGTIIENIVKVTYGGKELPGILIEEYANKLTKTEGEVRGWFLWGNSIFLIGEVKVTSLCLWITRAPKPMRNKGDVPEVPYYADNAIINYVIAACYRESRDFDRAQFYFNIFLRDKNMLQARTIPQGHRGVTTKMRDSYWGPEGARQVRRTDINPGGR